MAKKAKKKTPGKAGRPPKTVDWEIVKNLCVEHHTQGEIAAILGIDINTLKANCLRDNEINFSQFYKTNLKVGKSSIRKKLWEEAMNGNTQILLHHAKHHLNQWDKQQVDINIKPFVIENTNGQETIKLGAEKVDLIEGEEIDVNDIEASEQNYYDCEEIIDGEVESEDIE